MVPGFTLEERAVEVLILYTILDFLNLRIDVFPLFPELLVFLFFLIVSSNEITVLIFQILNQNVNLIQLGLQLFDIIIIIGNTWHKMGLNQLKHLGYYIVSTSQECFKILSE